MDVLGDSDRFSVTRPKSFTDDRHRTAQHAPFRIFYRHSSDCHIKLLRYHTVSIASLDPDSDLSRSVRLASHDSPSPLLSADSPFPINDNRRSSARRTSTSTPHQTMPLKALILGTCRVSLSVESCYCTTAATDSSSPNSSIVRDARRPCKQSEVSSLRFARFHKKRGTISSHMLLSIQASAPASAP